MTSFPPLRSLGAVHLLLPGHPVRAQVPAGGGEDGGIKPWPGVTDPRL